MENEMQVKIMALFYLLLLVFLCTCNAHSSDRTFKFCNVDAKISSSQVSANIDSLLAELVSSIKAQDGFSIASRGKGDDQVYGLAQCAGDRSSKDCLSCMKDASKEIRRRCPDQADARIWYDFCFLRYDTRKFFGQLDTSVGVAFAEVRNVTNPVTFNKKLGTLMDKVGSEAVMPGKRSFAAGEIKLSPFSNLYAIVQCTRDLSLLSCAKCLATAISQFPRACGHSEGCRVLYSTCRVHYDTLFRPRSTTEVSQRTDEKLFIHGL